ncbi:MAG TPA: EamA family transporter, partial [Negativicutes bacterium]|nr:EamA family transporter [Negativicutes bacterium]
HIVNRRDTGLGLIVIILWGLNFIAIKLGLSNMPSLLLAALRFVVLCLPAIFFLPKPPVSWKWLIALGLTMNVGQFAFLFAAIQNGMPAGLASLIHQSQAFFTVIFAAAFIGEKWRWNNMAGLLTAACGMVVIATQPGSTMTLIGFWLNLAGAASWGAGNVIMRHATKSAPPFSMLALIVWIGAVSILPLALLSFIIEGPAAWSAAFASINLTTIGSIIYLSYFASLIGYGLWGKLLSRYPAAVVAPFALLVPVVGMSSAAIFLGEAFSTQQLIGAVLLMAGLIVNVFGSSWFRRKEKIEKTENHKV